MSVVNELQDEIRTFEANRERLLGEALGKYVLIHGDQILGIYDTEGDAIKEGYKEVGNVPFLVRRVVEVAVPERFVSNLLAI
jgi:hypothetical protein